MENSKLKIIKKYIFISFLILAIIISALLIIRYNVEGEKNLPFEIEKIIIKSSIDTQSNESENIWDMSLTQNNDIYIYFEKNKDFNTEDIEKIIINNFKIEKIKEIGNIRILLPTSNDIKTCYSNSEVNYLEKGFEYTINTFDSLEKQEISSEGGMLAFRISNSELGNYISNEETEITYDGSLFEKAGISEDDLKFNINMDITIQISKNEKYKGTIKFNLPIEKFEEKSIINKELNNEDLDIIFKRVD